MEIVVKHLQADIKSGILSYRRKFPKELVRFIPSASPAGRGRVEMKISLRTPDIRQPGALELYLAIERDFQKIVDKARKVASGGYDPLEEPLIQYLASTYISNQLALDEAGRWKRPGPDFSYASRPFPEHDYEECRELLRDYDSAGLVAFWQEWVCEYAGALGYVLSPSDPAFPSLCQAMSEAACELWLALDKRIDGVAAQTPEPTEKPKVSSPPVPSSALITLQAAAEEIMGSKIDPVHHSSVSLRTPGIKGATDRPGSPD